MQKQKGRKITKWTWDSSLTTQLNYFNFIESVFKCINSLYFTFFSLQTLYVRLDFSCLKKKNIMVFWIIWCFKIISFSKFSSRESKAIAVVLKVAPWGYVSSRISLLCSVRDQSCKHSAEQALCLCGWSGVGYTECTGDLGWWFFYSNWRDEQAAGNL